MNFETDLTETEFGGGAGRIEIDPLYKRKEYIEGIMKLINRFGLECYFCGYAPELRTLLDQIEIRINKIR
jgi:hypothetical protein